MKPGAYVIKLRARTDLRNRRAARRVKSGKLLAVGLDVLADEPATANDPLVAAWQANEPWIRGRMLLNPHAGFSVRTHSSICGRKAVQDGVFLSARPVRSLTAVNAQYIKRQR